jgi:hypothetical protein
MQLLQGRLDGICDQGGEGELVLLILPQLILMMRIEKKMMMLEARSHLLLMITPQM